MKKGKSIIFVSLKRKIEAKENNQAGMKTTRHIQLIILLVLVCSYSCSRTDKSPNDNGQPAVVKQYEKWFVYDRPINGYDIIIHWQCDKTQLFTGTGSFFFSDAETTKTLTQAIDLDGWFDEKILTESPDTIILKQYYDETMQPHLDWRTFVGFADYNFDGEKELVVCGSPRPYRNFDTADWLDCEDFTFYKVFHEGFKKMGDEPFDILSTETCRTYCQFDTTHKTVLLLTSGGACCLDSTTYYFQDGLPFKSVEVRHEQLADTTIKEIVVLYYSYD